MFTLFLNPFTAVVSGSFTRGGLCRLKEMNTKGHDPAGGLDLIDRMHARLVNRGQYPIEHEGLDYWCHARDGYNEYNQARACVRVR